MRTVKTGLVVSISIILLVLLSFYIHRQSEQFLQGPVITIDPPPHGPLTDSFFTVSGKATNVAFLGLNGTQIYTDEKGAFSEKLLLLPGYNIIQLTAKDRFGRERVVSLEVVHAPSPSNSKTDLSSSTEKLLFNQ